MCLAGASCTVLALLLLRRGAPPKGGDLRSSLLEVFFDAGRDQKPLQPRLFRLPQMGLGCRGSQAAGDLQLSAQLPRWGGARAANVTSVSLTAFMDVSDVLAAECLPWGIPHPCKREASALRCAWPTGVWQPQPRHRDLALRAVFSS